MIKQLLRFGVVGVICTIIDFGLYTICNFLGVPYLISGIIGFSVSLIVNYILSMHFVFKRRNDISRRREFLVFVILSVIGLGIHELLLYIFVDIWYAGSAWMQRMVGIRAAEILAKVFATGVVMIFNFVTRKIFLEEKKTPEH